LTKWKAVAILPKNSRTNSALFAQGRLNFDATDLMLILRQDDNEAYGKEETSGIAFADTENRDTGARLPRRAEKNLCLDIDQLFAQWSLGASFIVESDRYNDPANTSLLPGYGTVDVRATWNFLPGWSALVKVDNVLDRRYATSQGNDSVTFEPFDYLAAGRTFMASVRYDFKQ
jgi:vitamin B12 transporter